MQSARQHIDKHGQAIHQVELLKHKANAGPRLANVSRDLPVLLNRPAMNLHQAVARVVAGNQTRHVAQQSGFAGARSTNQRHHLAGFDGQIDLLQGLAPADKGFAE